ncbi:hypothetical protein K474DRAFT_157479 [Panus rudis PR-1116 ss-1]|nr:hypothetical protein K474DRAFT_157479 [Panus rudis PR-1116 ss-1]
MMFENPEIFDHLARVLEFWPASDHFGAPQAPKITILRLHVVRIPEIWLKLALRPSREKIPNSRTTFLRIFGGPGFASTPPQRPPSWFAAAFACSFLSTPSVFTWGAYFTSMGVPALFRWLSKKYPKIVLPVIEEEEVKVPNEAGESVPIPIDISGPNPNGEEFDNLYLDMNGIVHPCTHPEGKPAPETEEEMMVEIFNYTERVVNMIRPRKLLFMAIGRLSPICTELPLSCLHNLRRRSSSCKNESATLSSVQVSPGSKGERGGPQGSPSYVGSHG